ncbi:MAG TPA: molybdopterin-dependent oxidoreductase, partial [Rhabdaerophilum sp.]|nr:molybdopterin-dependent oxidoreductase [Rhabdaerophilum sp.]
MDTVAAQRPQLHWRWLDIEDEAARNCVQRFWNAPGMAERPGLKAVDLFRAAGEGKVKALWIMSTNPVDSLPEADLVRKALEVCPFVVVSDAIRETDTNACADVLLPALTWGEKSGTVTNSERRISRQRSFLPPPGEARADWWHMA